MHESTNSRSARGFKSLHDQPVSDLKCAFIKTSYLEKFKREKDDKEASKIVGKRRGWNETQTHASWFQVCHAMVFKHEDASDPAMNGVISTKTVFSNQTIYFLLHFSYHTPH